MLSKNIQSEIYSLYCNDLLTIGEISKRLKITYYQVRKYLIQNQIPIRCGHRPLKTKNRFVNLNKEDYYWLGFFYNRKIIIGKSLTFKSSDNHTKRFKKFLGISDKLHQFRLVAPQIVQSLKNIGIGSSNIPQIPQRHIITFLRGWIDGCGSIRQNVVEYKGYNVFMSSVRFRCKSFLQAQNLQRILDKLNIKFDIWYRNDNALSCYYLISRKQVEQLKLLILLYGDADEPKRKARYKQAINLLRKLKTKTAVKG